MSIDKINNLSTVRKQVNFQTTGNTSANSVTSSSDEEKSMLMGKMVGLGALGVVVLGGIYYLATHGKTTTKQTEQVINQGKDEVNDLIKKILRKDGTLLRTIEKNDAGEIISEKVFANDGKTLNFEYKFVNGKKIKKIYYKYDGKAVKSVIERVGERFKKTEYLAGGTTVTQINRNGRIYESVQKAASGLTDESVVVKRYDPKTGDIVKTITQLNGQVVSIGYYKNGKLYKNVNPEYRMTAFYDSGQITKNIFYEKDGNIQKVSLFDPNSKNLKEIAYIKYVDGQPYEAMRYNEDGKVSSKLKYNDKGQKEVKELYSNNGDVESLIKYDEKGCKSVELSYYPDKSVKERILYHPNGKPKIVETYLEGKKNVDTISTYKDNGMLIKCEQFDEDARLLSENNYNPENGRLSSVIMYKYVKSNKNPDISVRVKDTEIIYDSSTDNTAPFATRKYDDNNRVTKIQRGEFSIDFKYNEDGSYFKEYGGKIEKFDANNKLLGEYTLKNGEYVPVQKDVKD